MGWPNGKKVIKIPSIHPTPTKGVFQFCVHICGGLDGLIGCEGSLVQWSDVKKANLLWCPSIHPSIQHRSPPPPTPHQDVCFLLVWGGGSDGWTGWYDRDVKKVYYCDKLWGCYVCPSDHFLETCKLFSFPELNFFCFFVFLFFLFFFGPSLFLPWSHLIQGFQQLRVCNLSWAGSDMWKRLVFKHFNVEFCPLLADSAHLHHRPFANIVLSGELSLSCVCACARAKLSSWVPLLLSASRACCY